MAGDKKEVVKKEVKKELKKLKITKSNGRVIYRDNMEGLEKSYKKKGGKVEGIYYWFLW